MHFNFYPLKKIRAQRVLDFGDKWLTGIGEELLLPDIQRVRDMEKLGWLEEVGSGGMMERAQAKSLAEAALLAKIFAKSEPVSWKGRFKAWIKKFVR